MCNRILTIVFYFITCRCIFVMLVAFLHNEHHQRHLYPVRPGESPGVQHGPFSAGHPGVAGLHQQLPQPRHIHDLQPGVQEGVQEASQRALQVAPSWQCQARSLASDVRSAASHSLS